MDCLIALCSSGSQGRLKTMVQLIEPPCLAPGISGLRLPVPKLIQLYTMLICQFNNNNEKNLAQLFLSLNPSTAPVDLKQ